MKNYHFVYELLTPYRKKVGLNIMFNFLSSLLSVFTFGSIVPFLNILFKEVQTITPHPGKFDLSSDYFLSLVNHKIEFFIVHEGKQQALLGICAFIIIVFFLKNICSYLGQYQMAYLRNAVVRDLRQKIHSRILQLPLLYFNDERKGNVLTKATSDVTEIEFSIMGSLQMFFRDPITFFIYLITLLIMSWELTIFVLVLLPISGFIISRMGKKLKNAAGRGQNKLGEVMSLFDETLGGLRVIKSFNAEDNIHHKFETESNNFFELMVKLFRRQYLASPLSEIMGSISIAVVLYFGGALILDGNSSFDGAFFVTFLIIFSQLIPPAKSFSEGFFKLKKGLASTERINELYKEPSEPLHKGKNIVKTTFDGSIVLRNTKFTYKNGANALNDVSLSINKGSSTALVGQSGSGKSTLVSILPLFITPNKGEIFIDGIDILDIELKSLRNLFGIVSQEAILFNDSVAYNVKLGKPQASDAEVIEALKIANAWEFVEKLENGINQNIGENGNKLSGGQKQRLSIARAVLANAPILLLDEATSALDTESEKIVQAALENLMKGRTSVVIAHRLSTVSNTDKIVVMQDGEIIEEGAHKELLATKGKYYNLCSLQGIEA
jgi:subfamily B ATP-binding cassette protein MsbA